MNRIESFLKLLILFSKWEIKLGDGTDMTVDMIITAVGLLHKPHLPKFKGDDSFKVSLIDLKNTS